MERDESWRGKWENKTDSEKMIATDKPYLVLDYPDTVEAHSPRWTDLPELAGASWTSLSKIPFESVHLVG